MYYINIPGTAIRRSDKGNRMLFNDVTCSIIAKDDAVIATGHQRGNLYVLDGAA